MEETLRWFTVALWPPRPDAPAYASRQGPDEIQGVRRPEVIAGVKGSEAGFLFSPSHTGGPAPRLAGLFFTLHRFFAFCFFTFALNA